MENQESDRERMERLRQEKRTRKSLRRMQRVAAALQAASDESASAPQRKPKARPDDEDTGDRKSA